MLNILPRVLADTLGEGYDFRDLRALCDRPFRDRQVSALLTALWRRARAGAGIEGLSADETTAALAGRLASAAEGGPAAPRGGLPPRTVRLVTAMIAETDNDVMSLSELASVAGLSPWHFARAFRDTLGVPPHRYQKLMRVQRARDLLAGTRLAVSDVAQRVGYGSGQALARIFRQEMGVTPEQFRMSRCN